MGGNGMRLGWVMGLKPKDGLGLEYKGRVKEILKRDTG